jgi:hypothetical protein
MDEANAEDKAWSGVREESEIRTPGDGRIWEMGMMWATGADDVCEE